MELKKGDFVIYTPKNEFDQLHGHPMYVGVISEFDEWFGMYIVNFRNNLGTNTIRPNFLKKISPEIAEILLS